MFSCSPRAVGSRPWPMVLRDHCLNCSVRLIPPYLSKLESREGRLKVWDLASRPTNLQDKMISVTSASVFLMCSTNRDPWLFGTAMTSRRSARDAATYSFRAASALFAGCPVVR